MSVMIQSSARGSWSSEFGEGKDKFVVAIGLGINELTEKEYKAVKDDPGFQALEKRHKFKVLKPADMKRKEKEEAKAQAKIQELEQAKAQHKEVVADLKEKFESEKKAEKVKFDNERNTLIASINDLKVKNAELEKAAKGAEGDNAKLAEAMKKIDELEKENKVLVDQNEATQKKLNDATSKVKDENKKRKAAESEVAKLQAKLKE